MTSSASPGESRPARADLSLRQVGESYKDYAARMAGAARAAEIDRDQMRRMAAETDQDRLAKIAELFAELDRLREQRDAVLALHHKSDGGGYCIVCAEWDRDAGASGTIWPCDTVRALGVTE